MYLQEVYQYVDYYNIVFFVGMFIQDHFKDFISTLVCFLMSTLGVSAIEFIQSCGYTYWESTMFFEAILFSISIFLIGTKTGWILFFVTTTAFFVNFIGYLIPKDDFYVWYSGNYGVINIILFEVLVWTCIVNSRLKPYLDKFTRLSNIVLKRRIRKLKRYCKRGSL